MTINFRGKNKFLMCSFYQDDSIAFGTLTIYYLTCVTDTYDILEVIQMKIKLDELENLYSRVKKRDIFKVFAHNRYGFTKEMGETVFGILKGGYQKLLAEYIESLGYILV